MRGNRRGRSAAPSQGPAPGPSTRSQETDPILEPEPSQPRSIGAGSPRESEARASIQLQEGDSTSGTDSGNVRNISAPLEELPEEEIERRITEARAELVRRERLEVLRQLQGDLGRLPPATAPQMPIRSRELPAYPVTEELLPTAYLDTGGTAQDVRGRSPRRPRSEGNSPPQQHKRRAIRPKEPSPFTGRSLAEYRDYIQSCELAFHLAAEDFADDKDKVLWAAQFLDREPKMAWRLYQNSRLRSAGDWNSLSWENYKTFVLDNVGDKTNRGLEAHRRYMRAEQRPNQSVQEFTLYLESLEAELDEMSEAERVKALFHRLRDELQADVTNHHPELPATRLLLVQYATRYELNRKKLSPQTARTGAAASKDRGSRPSRGGNSSTRARGGRGRGGQYRGGAQHQRDEYTPNADRDLSHVECFSCGKKGHYATTCPDSKKEKTNPNYAPIGSTRAGKARTPQRGQSH